MTRMYGKSGDAPAVELIYEGDEKEKLDSKTPIVVMLDGLEIQEFYSRDRIWHDPLTRREGTLMFSFGKQETSLSWATEEDQAGDGAAKLMNADKFRGQVLYVGPAGTPSAYRVAGKSETAIWNLLNCELTMLESDEEDREFFHDLAAALGLAGKLAASVPAYKDAISAGAQALQQIAVVIRERIRDDVEMNYQGALAERHPEVLGVRRGSYALRRSHGGEENLRLGLNVFELKPPKAGDWIQVAVDDLRIRPNDSIDLRYEIAVEMAAGNQSGRAISMKLPGKNGEHPFPDFLGVQNHLVYAGELKAAMQWSLSVAAMPRKRSKAEDQAIIKLINVLGAFAKAYADKKTDKEIDKVTSAIQSVRSYLAEFNPKKRMIGKASGLFLPQSSDVHNEIDGACVIKIPDGHTGKGWHKTDPILLRSTGGEVEVTFRYRRDRELPLV